MEPIAMTGFRMEVVFCSLVFGDRTVQTTPLSIKDQEEKARRCEFVHGMLLSTIFDDKL
ncbi:hypothetical protein CK203_021229 [Vitis vinifera]|uniref:Di19 C-terminal domain-containing protein n=1 Tax=Vitis vinifera TaxID=29760 RepID=A0A438IMT8_VITVI|nr:hypothetical protein CK203_021229 [Vitis vinifera]